MATARLEGVRQRTAANGNILQFPLLGVTAECPRCLWCRDKFAPCKPNQLYCKPKHRQRACECRKAQLGTAVAALLQRHGMTQKRAQDAADDLIERYYACGRVQRAVEALGWMYDEVSKTWLGQATGKPTTRDGG